MAENQPLCRLGFAASGRTFFVGFFLVVFGRFSFFRFVFVFLVFFVKEAFEGKCGKHGLLELAEFFGEKQAPHLFAFDRKNGEGWPA
jgi:hypothetical protein